MQHLTTPPAAGSWGGTLERPRYFPRQLMTPDELTLEANYFRDRLRRHNVYLHGWGVVCGALVCVVPADGAGTKPWTVTVQAGYVLGPYGDEIVIGSGCEVSLRGGSTGGGTGGCGCGGGCDVLDDPWCTEVYVEQPDGPRYVAVRYRECRVRPVRAQPAGCGCDETPCEYSRYRDGYEFRVLDACPQSHQHADDDADDDGNPTCPAMPDSPWVVLAKVMLDDDGTITTIDNCACRRIVASTRDRWYSCGSTDADHPPPDKEKAATPPKESEPASASAGDATAAATPDRGHATPAEKPNPMPPPRRRRRATGGDQS
jgi:hypothetical protein